MPPPPRGARHSRSPSLYDPSSPPSSTKRPHKRSPSVRLRSPSPPRRPVPRWLERQQEQLSSGASSINHRYPPSQPSSQSLRPSSSSLSTAAAAASPDNDFIIIDMLDGAHLPTKSAPPMPALSSTSDAIVSLPPVAEHAVPDAWHALMRRESRAQRAGRRDARGAASLTSVPTPVTPRAEAPLAPAVTPACALPPRPRHKRQLSSGNHALHGIPADVPRQHAEAAAPPLPHHDANGQPTALTPLTAGHERAQPSFSRDDDLDSEAASGSTRTTPSLHAASTPGDRLKFRPNEWGWRRPAEEDVVMPHSAWVYLALIGCLTFIAASLINAASQALISHLIDPLAALAAATYGRVAHLATLSLLRSLCLALSFALVLKLSPNYSAGSGIPEMKCVLSGVLMPNMLNRNTLIAKMLGLIFSLSSSISIGRLGPFIHLSAIIAALIAQLPVFPSLRTNARYQLQALSAAIAAGVGATFAAPIGGTMLAIELMSTYYYIHWLPMALYCSIMGYYFSVAIMRRPSPAYFNTTVTVDMDVESVRRLCTFVLLGAVCGVVGAMLVWLTKTLFKLRRAHFKNSTPARTMAMLVAFAALHTVILAYMGGVIDLPQHQGVNTLFAFEQSVATEWLPNVWKPFAFEPLNAAMAIMVVLTVKFVLTAVSLVLPVPAGTFMPIFEIGALVGRAFGEMCVSVPFVQWVDPRATAIVGAAAVTSGTLHTTSIAIVMLELTREAIDVLPLAVGVIVSYGVSKYLCADLFSELIKIRRLPFILGLRERYPSENDQFYEDVSSEVAGSFMTQEFPFVTPYTTRGEIYDILTHGGRPWINCAFVSDKEQRLLWGTVSRQTLWEIVLEDMSLKTGGGYHAPEYGSFNASERAATRGLETVPMFRDFDPSVGHALVDMGPMQVSYHTPFWKIITFFRMLSMTTMYVMKDGKTVGSVNKTEVINHSFRLEERARRKRRNAEAQRGHDEQLQLDGKRLSAALHRTPGLVGGMRTRPSQQDLMMSSMLAERRAAGHSRQGSWNRGNR